MTLAAASGLALLGAVEQSASAHGTDPTARAAAKATRLVSVEAGSLAEIGGVTLDGAAFGSALTPVPDCPGQFYGLTDRGPNVDGPDGSKVEPLPEFTPSIARLRVQGGRAVVLDTIALRLPDGTPLNGRVSPEADTGETILDLDGKVLEPSSAGLDPEGLVAMRDGSFWVSDEYGPYMVHFDSTGREIERLSPYDGSLPAELAAREPNKGMEGLTITPDGDTLVGVMQAALNAPDGEKSKKVSVIRIVTVSLASRETHEYVALLNNAQGADTGISEITALADGTFLLAERDGEFAPGATKALWRVDLREATDVGPKSVLAEGVYDAEKGGLLVEGRTVEAIAGKGNTDQTRSALMGAGIAVAHSSRFLDVAGLVTAVDPTGGFFGHDKIEGVAVIRHGRTLVLSNDSDFGISGLVGDAPPWQLEAKVLPDGSQDSGQLLFVDVAKVPASLR